MKSVVVLLALTLQVSVLFASAPLWRKDLQQAGGKLLCTDKPKLQVAWQLQIYDTLLAARLVPKSANLATEAKQYAQNTANFGYSFGACNKRAWLLTVSAPYQAQVKQGVVTLAPELQNYCKSLRAKFAPNGLQMPKTLSIKKLRLVLPKQGNGLVAVSCQSLSPLKVGPRLLYAFPVGKPHTLAPLLSYSEKSKDLQQATATWLNALRKKMHLSAVQFLPYDQTTRFSVIHDRVELAKTKKSLQQVQQVFLGENRVRAHSLQEALSMFWLSPFHRELLLHKTAKRVYLQINKKQNQLLLTMVVAG